MHINLFKHAKLGSLVVAGALASSMAHATTFNIGGFEVNMDTTVSAGATWLVSDRHTAYLPESNGGNPNLNFHADALTMATAIAGGAAADVAAFGAACDITQGAYGGFCQTLPTSVTFNHDGSINSDDGRLNFDQGDITSAPFKATLEFETQQGNLQAFLRTTMYYDVALMEDGSFERGGLTNKGRNNCRTRI